MMQESMPLRRHSRMPAARHSRMRAIRSVLAAAALAVGAGACASGGYGASGGASGGGLPASMSRRDERVVLGSYAEVQAVAVSRRYVFAGTLSGFAVYDRAFSRWLPPLINSGAYAGDQITAIGADPLDDALWYGVPGAVVMYRPDVDQVQRTMVIGVPDLIAFDRTGTTGTGDVLVRSGGQWTRITRTGIAAPMAGPPSGSRVYVPPTLADVYRQFPQLRSQLALQRNTANRPLRRWSAISGTLAPDRTTEAWLGSNGDGLWKVDATFMQTAVLHFGPLERGIGALAATVDGVWSAGLGESTLRGGIAYGSHDLQQWEWIDGTIAVPLTNTRAHALAVRANSAWMGSDRGLYRIQLDGARDVTAWSSLDGLPGDRVFAVATRPTGVWAGTDRGLAFIVDTAAQRDRSTRDIARVLLENTPIRALQAIGDTLWIGTDAGLLALAGSNATTLLRPAGDDIALRRPVRALAWSDTVLLVATDDVLLRVAPRGGAAPQRLDIDPRTVGQVTRVAIDERTIFVGGSDGVLSVQRDGGVRRLLRTGSDIPGPVLDVVAVREWVWLATPGGMVRLRRTADGGLP